MTTMISEVYDALRDAQGVSEEKARSAAVAVAQFDTRFNEVKVSLEALRGEMKVSLEALRGEMKALDGRVSLVQWQLVALIGGVVAIILRVYLH